MTEAILIFILSLMGAFVLRVCGFGFGVFTMAWLPYLLPSRRSNHTVWNTCNVRVNHGDGKELETYRLA